MSIFSTFGTKLSHWLHGLFTGHALTYAQTLANDALNGIAAVQVALAVAGAPAKLTEELGKISAALSAIVNGATSAAVAADLTAQTKAFGDAVDALVTSGDLHIKNPQTQTAIVQAVSRVESVVAALVPSAA
jgi:hypothetical protein